jgi:hypothetical protein
MHSGRVRMEFPERVPASLNVVAGRPSAGPYRRFKNLWGGLITEQLLAAQARGELPAVQGGRLDEAPRGQIAFVQAAAVARFTTQRPRDEGNFRAPLEKALGDALVGDRRAWPMGRWLPDDTAEHYRFQGMAIAVDRRQPGLTVIEFEWRRETLV